MQLNILSTQSKGMCACLAAQSCPTLCDPVDCSPAGSSVHGISQATILEWVAISFSRGSSQARDPTQVSWKAGRFFTIWATREAHGSPPKQEHPQHPRTTIQPQVAIVGRMRNWCKGWEWEKELWHQMLGGWACRGGRWTDLVISSWNLTTVPAVQETRFNPWSERSLEKGMATQSSVLAWEFPWTEEPGGLQFMGLQKSGTHLSN